MVDICIEMVVHESVNLVLSLARSDMVEIEVLYTIRQDHWKDCMVLVFADLELSTITDKHPCLIIQDAV